MKQKVKFELMQPLMCGGVRIADNFLESEQFIRGSVLRAGFAKGILLECPLSCKKALNGKNNYIELKDADGLCRNCPNRSICEKFSEMRFSFAYPDNSVPAPFTAKQCKQCGTVHPIKDTIIENGMLRCDKCSENSLGRMENIKGMLNAVGDSFKKVKVKMTLSIHTAINYNSNIADDGSLYSVKAISKGQFFTAEIDDCGTGMIYKGAVVYVGKYSSTGFGKLKIVSVEPVKDVTDDDVRTRIDDLNSEFKTENLISLLFLSDTYPCEMKCVDRVLSNEEYLEYWTETLFGNNELPFSVVKIFTETQLYSGYDTSREWGSWKQEEPELMLLKGTSVLLKVKEGCMDKAIKLLTALQSSGIGSQTENGFGQFEICHRIHCIGVKKHEK